MYIGNFQVGQEFPELRKCRFRSVFPKTSTFSHGNLINEVSGFNCSEFRFIMNTAKNTPGLISLPSLAVIVVSCLFMSSAALCQNSEFELKNFSREIHSGDYQNWAVAQGPEGIMYFANNSGLLEYDGINWEFHNSPLINNIRAVAADSVTKRIYTAGYREIGFWERDAKGILQYQSYMDKIESELLQNEEFWKIIIYSGKVVFQSFNGIFILEEGEFTLFRPDGFLNTISLIRNSLYLCIQNEGIYHFENDTMSLVLEDSSLNSNMIRFLLPFGNEGFLIGTASGGLFRFHKKSLFPAFENLQPYFELQTINRGCVLNDSVIAIGTILDGVTVMDTSGNLLFRINEENGLQNNTVLDLYLSGNNLWAALDRGISFINLFSEPSYKIYTVKEIGAVYSAAIHRNDFYLGTNQGLYVRPIKKNNDSFRLVPGTQGQVWDCRVIDDQLFISHNSGTFVINEAQIRKISDVNGGFTILENPFQLNTLLQCTYSDLVFFKKEKESWMFSHRLANFNDLIRFIEMDHLGNLWAGHMRRGVYKLRLNDQQTEVIDARYYGKNSVFSQEYGIHVFKLENRIVFTTGDKLYTYDDLNDSILPLDQVNSGVGSYSKSHRIVNAGGHYYWFIKKGGVALFYFEPTGISLIREFPMELFGNHFIEDYENIIPLGSKKGLLCLENGYAMLDAELSDSRYEIRNFNPILKSFTISNNALKSERLPIDDKDFQIHYHKNNLNIRYAFPHFSAHNIRFTYLVQGLENDWSEPKKEPEIQINRLPSGKYTIRVKAVNEWGVSSPEHAVFIEILAPWYSSVAAVILYFFLLLGIILFVRYTSIRKIKEKEKKKREMKEQELIRLRNENLRAELSYKSRELANSTMSIIKKNEFLLELKNLLKNQKYQLGTRYPDKYYDHVIGKIEKNISGGDDWKIFEMNVEQAHEAFVQKLIHKYPELSHSDLRLCTYLRMNLSSKEIAPLMRISVRGVENHRYKIRKKLGLKPEENLTDFILGFQV